MILSHISFFNIKPITFPHYLYPMINWNSPTPPKAPFIASIFNYYLSDDLDGYEEYDILTLDLVKTMPGYLGYESMKHNGRGTFISYWKDMEAVQNWAHHPTHIEAKKRGATWYKYYHSMIASVERFKSS
jgi:heme-degrading monooxygenase HmoA